MLANKVSSLLPKGLAAAKTQTRSLSAITAASSSPLSPSLGQRNLQEHQNFNISSTHFRSYVSRAHPKPIPEFSVPIGLQMVLDGVEERKKHRATKWERNKDKRRSKGIEVSILKQTMFDQEINLQIKRKRIRSNLSNCLIPNTIQQHHLIFF